MQERRKIQQSSVMGAPRMSPALRKKKVMCATGIAPHLGALVAVCLVLASAFAQETSTSGVVGRVTDTSGAVVPGATIHIVNIATSAERTTTSNGNGEFSVPNLPPATYQLHVDKAGFKTTAIQSFDLLVGKVANESVVLDVGSTSETVNVTAEAQQLQTTDAAVGQVIDHRQIADLPLNGRNVLQLATLAAGVSPAQFAKHWNARAVRHPPISISRSTADGPVRPTMSSTACTCVRSVSMSSPSNPRSIRSRSSIFCAAASRRSMARGRR